MPNYLEGAQSSAVSTTSGSPADAPRTDVSSGSEKVPLNSEGTNAGGGSKPMALHTEYATGESEGPAYGSQDIVFYLQRADADQDNSTEGDAIDPQNSKKNEEQSSSQNNNISLNGGTGPNNDKGQVPSGINNIAADKTGRSLGQPEGGPMAPMTGMSIDDEVDIGSFTQNASRYVDVSAAAANAVRYVESLGSDQVKLSLASSERLFSGILARSFNPEEDLSGIRDAETILGTLSRPTQSELAFQLAREVGGRCRAKDIVKAINDGEVGLVNAKARAYQERMGSVRGSNR